MSIVRLFTMTPDGELEVNKVELLTYDVFKEIIRRDRGRVGDAQGRRKQQAIKEFSYIYHFADVRSDLVRRGYDNKTKQAKAIEAVGLPDNWKPDLTIIKAIEIYESEQDAFGADLVREILAIFGLNTTVAKKVKGQIKELIERTKLSPDEVNEVLKLSVLVYNFAKEIPQLTSDLETVLSNAKLDESKYIPILRGTTVAVPESMDPDRAIS